MIPSGSTCPDCSADHPESDLQPRSCPCGSLAMPRRGVTAPDAPPPAPEHPLRAQDVKALIAKRIG